MNITLATTTASLTTPNAPEANAAAKNIGKNQKAARDFEAMLLTPVLESLQKTFSGEDESKMPGAGDYRALGSQALAQAIAARGGIGIAQLILRHLPPPKVPGGG